jgi:hypothetical protein
MDFGFDGPDLSPMGYDETPTASTALKPNDADTLRQARWELASVLN